MRRCAVLVLGCADSMDDAFGVLVGALGWRQVTDLAVPAAPGCRAVWVSVFHSFSSRLR